MIPMVRALILLKVAYFPFECDVVGQGVSSMLNIIYIYIVLHLLHHASTPLMLMALVFSAKVLVSITDYTADVRDLSTKNQSKSQQLRGSQL